MPTNEQIESLYEVRPQDYDDMSVTALELNASVGALKTLTLTFPAAPLYFGFRPVETSFEYDVPTVVGVLVLYKYPGGVAANKVLLASINLEDQAYTGKQFTVKVSQFPPTAVGVEGHALEPYANCDPQDQLVVYILTQATGGGYLEGDFQPVLIMQKRPFSYAGCPTWIDRTPASAGISDQI